MGQMLSGLQIVIIDKTTSLSGSVTDTRGTAVTDVTVVLLSDETLWTYQSRFACTASGSVRSVSIQGLPPTSGTSPSRCRRQDGQAGDAEHSSRIRAQGVSFSLGDGETKALDLRFK